MHSILRAINRVNRLAGILAGFFTAVIALVVCYGVIVRYLLNQPIGWSEEVGTYLMIWAAFLGAGYTLQVKGHIGVDIVSRKLPAAVQSKLSLVKHLVGIVFLLLLAAKGIEDCALSVRLGEVSISELAIPMVIPQLALPVGSVLLALQLIEQVLTRLTEIDTPQESSK